MLTEGKMTASRVLQPMVSLLLAAGVAAGTLLAVLR